MVKALPTGDAGVLVTHDHHPHHDDEDVISKPIVAGDAPVSALVIGDMCAAIASSALVAPFVR